MNRYLRTFTLVAAVLFSLVAIVRLCQERRLRTAEEEHERIKALVDRYFPKWADVPKDKARELTALYAEAVHAYENRSPVALHDVLHCVDGVLTSLPGAIGSNIAAPLETRFNKDFYFAQQTSDFAGCTEFEDFMRLNREVVMHLGKQDMQRGEFDILLGRDYLTYLRIRQYKDKFHAENKPQLEKMADRFLGEWVEHIESTNSFTRLAIRGTILLNSDYAEARWPGRGWSREDCARAARARTRGLINVGYTPKWLDLDYPDPDTKVDKSESR